MCAREPDLVSGAGQGVGLAALTVTVQTVEDSVPAGVPGAAHVHSSGRTPVLSEATSTSGVDLRKRRERFGF